MTAERLVPPPDDRDAAAAAAARFAATAPADLVYAEVDSPVGRLLAAATPRGLATLSYEDHHGGLDAVLDALAAKLSPRIVEAPARLDDIRRELDEYFEGRRTSFDLRLDWALARGFSSYARVAAAAGSPKATRAAGNALGTNPIPIVVPCHRVLRTGGALGGYTGGVDRKQALLTLEGARLG